jgi:steroid delta-isomerase-like uncharacterized protein
VTESAGPATRTQDVEAVARGVFAAIDRRDLEAIAGFLHPEDQQLFRPIGQADSKDAVVAVFADMFAAFPDLRIEVQDVGVVGQHAYVRWHASGTFTGQRYQGLLATGRAVQIFGVDAFIEVEDGLVRRNTIYYDGAAFARSVGALPAQGSLGEKALLGMINLRTRFRQLLGRRVAGR